MLSNANNTIIGYRAIPINDSLRGKGKSSVDHALDAFNVINTKYNIKKKNLSVICMDITGFFDNLNHSTLINKTERLFGLSEFNSTGFSRVLDSVIKYQYISRDLLYSPNYDILT